MVFNAIERQQLLDVAAALSSPALSTTNQSALDLRGTESIPSCKETWWLELAIFNVSIQHVEAAKNIPARNKALVANKE